MKVLNKGSLVGVAAVVAPLVGTLVLVPFRTGRPTIDEALVPIVVVVAVSAAGNRIAGLVAAVSTAVWFAYFLVPPYYQFKREHTEDLGGLLVLLAVSAAVSQLAILQHGQRELAQAAHARLKLLHDAGRTIGTTLDAEATAHRLAHVAVPRFADFVTVDLLASMLPGHEATSASGELQRVAVAGVREDHPFAAAGVSTQPAAAGGRTEASDDAYARIEVDVRRSDDWQSCVSESASDILSSGIRSLIWSPLRAHDALLGCVCFWRLKESQPFDQADLSDAEELAATAAAAVDNARRYTRERYTALTLQRDLLPRRLPTQTAVEAASRYLPADSEAGVGGDWFDVIRLSGSRVALVVGDVVGHGINASATMGRLRTAVRTLADVDLPPDELLTCLDDLVIHLNSDEQSGASEAGDLGATCIYAVYDPVSGQCVVASAGHPLPLYMTPDGKVRPVSGSIGPPLGLGGLPFEAIELELPTGSVLALFSDGLIESRERDIDENLDTLKSALQEPTASLDAACDNVIRALVVNRPEDDVALLLARTRTLTPDSVASWDVPADPARVAWARQVAVETLEGWGLEDSAFITELVVSELVTNAIRYGASPIELRLIRDRTLICEVSDASNTVPHLRRARVFDEGGRGLLLVANLSQNWGSRHSRLGKTIWCEQDFSGGQRSAHL